MIDRISSLAGLVFVLLPVLIMIGTVAEGAPETVTIRAQSGLKYDRLRFQVSPGQAVRIRLINEDEMPHNIVFTASGKRLAVVKAAENLGQEGTSAGYVPDTPQVLASLPVIKKGEEKVLTFTAPEKPGVYPYVCTFPGHGYTMYGAMYVGDQELPPLAEDPNVPDRHVDGTTQTGGEGLNLPHPFTARRPFMYRIKMPRATQASIAVALKNGQNYCWDAGRHRLRYVWKGGFVDPMPNFSGKGHETPKIKGKIYYRSKTFPLRFGSPDRPPENLDFKGYRMREGRPEFEVKMDGVEVRQLITSLPDVNGIVHRFRMRNVQKPVWFVTDPEGDVRFSSPDGSFDGKGRLKLSPENAKEFRVQVVQIPQNRE